MCRSRFYLEKHLLRSLKTPTILGVFQIAQNYITWITLVWTEAVYGSNSLACHWQKPLDFNEVVLDMYFYNFTLSTSQIYHNFIVGLSSLVNATRENPLFPNLFLAFIKSRQPWFSWNVRTKHLIQKNTLWAYHNRPEIQLLQFRVFNISFEPEFGNSSFDTPEICVRSRKAGFENLLLLLSIRNQ